MKYNSIKDVCMRMKDTLYMCVYLNCKMSFLICFCGETQQSSINTQFSF
jgi:hypothetical protein